MGDANGVNGAEDTFLKELEAGVRAIIKSKKSSKADKLSAINAGVKIAAIKHRIMGGDGEKGFFDR
jgi:hypothetical protein